MLRLTKALPQLPTGAAQELMALANSENPFSLRAIAASAHLIDSTQLFDDFGDPEQVPVGEALPLEHGQTGSASSPLRTRLQCRCFVSMSDETAPRKKRALDFERAERRTLLALLPPVAMPVFQAEKRRIIALAMREAERKKARVIT
jgi:hypothetical protein